MRRWLVGFVVVASLVASGCDQSPDKKKDQNVSISTAEGKLTIKSDDGKSKIEIGGDNDSAAASMPAFAPLYPGGKVQSSMLGAASGSGGGGGVVFTTSASTSDVIAFYRKKAAAAGMKQTSSAKIGPTEIFSASNEDTKAGFHVSVQSEQGNTEVSLFWSKGG